jgi:hypothetical protein
MKKMLPEGAVRQKMSVDGFTSVEIEDFISGVDTSLIFTHKWTFFVMIMGDD